MRVLVFGDSIAQGFWDAEGGWVGRIRKAYDEQTIREQNYSLPVVFNLGVSADRSAHVLKRFEPETTARLGINEKLAFVIAIGTNDACVEAGKTRSSPAKYKQNTTAIVQRAQKYSSKILLVELTPCDETKTTPVSWGNYAYHNADIRRLNQVLAEIAAEQNVPLVPVFDAFSGKEKQLLPDGLHPNAKGHELIAGFVRPRLDDILGLS
jgi:lysophospholipase L1-like esterase